MEFLKSSQRKFTWLRVGTWIDYDYDVIQVKSVQILLLLLCSIIFTSDGQIHPWYRDVKIQQGSLRGILMRSQRGHDFYGFIGIPYATPPLANFRFRVPVPHSGWSGLYDATKYRPPCPQLDVRGNSLGSEDCLYLNVFSPAILIRDSKLGTPPLLPVMVYIQGESYENGDSALYGPEKLLDKDVLLVTFNYRLGILGFLSTGDEVATGNWGLYDQKLVLEWVHKNIPLFGGDPTRVTLFGQGAGAASALFLTMSPLLQDQRLFHRVILQSGSALCDWSYEKSPLLFTRKVAHDLQCEGVSTAEMVDCLRNSRSVDQLLVAQSQGKVFGEFPQRAAPVVERAGHHRLIPDDPKAMLEKGDFTHVPLMGGVTSDETSYFYPLLVQAYGYGMSLQLLETNLLPRFLEAATPFKGIKKDEIVESILFTYFNALDPQNMTNLALRFINMSTDALYTSCMDQTLKMYSEAEGANVYMYLFEKRGVNSMVNLLLSNEATLFKTGVCHGDELFHLFDLKIDGLRPQPPIDYHVGEKVLTLWSDFAKHGTAPHSTNYEYPRWDTFQSESPNFLRIGRELRPDVGHKQREADFWNHRLPSIAGTLQAGGGGGSGTSARAGLLSTRPVYKTVAWAMVAVSISLVLLVGALLAILYYQKREESLRGASPESPSALSAGSSALY